MRKVFVYAFFCRRGVVGAKNTPAQPHCAQYEVRASRVPSDLGV
jgi:hypothetical protein